MSIHLLYMPRATNSPRIPHVSEKRSNFLGSASLEVEGADDVVVDIVVPWPPWKRDLRDVVLQDPCRATKDASVSIQQGGSLEK